MGTSARSRIARWVRASRHMLGEIKEALRQDENSMATDKFIFDNEFFVSPNDKKLKPSFALRALSLLRRAKEDGCPFTAEAFQSNCCAPLKMVENWRRQLNKAFGSKPDSLPATERVLDYLCSLRLLPQIKNLARENIPLHGTSAQNPGVQVARDLWLELEKIKSGKDQGATTDGGGKAPEPGAAVPDGDGDVALMSVESEVLQEDPVLSAPRLHLPNVETFPPHIHIQ